jgi:hypothetical protein
MGGELARSLLIVLKAVLISEPSQNIREIHIAKHPKGKAK